MLTADGCATRRQRLWEALDVDCDLLLISDPAHLTYFTNFDASPFEFRSNDAGALAVLVPGRATLIGDNLLTPYLQRSYVDTFVAPVWYESKRSAPHRRGFLVNSVLEFLEEQEPKRIGVEFGAVPVGIVEGLRGRLPAVELVNLDAYIRPLRRSKDADELSLLRRSMKAADAGFAKAMQSIRPGMTEQDAFRIIQEAVNAAAGEPVRLYGDFVSGRRTEAVGGPPSNRTIARGDLFLLDMSVVVHGYRGDYANTFCVGAPPTVWQGERFEACLEALAAGESLLKPGVACREVDAAVRGVFTRRGLADHFPSHSGHGLGLGHPEPPFFVRQSEETLVVGDVVALEPGLYVPGEGGMRYERNYLITAHGPQVLSGHELKIEVG